MLSEVSSGAEQSLCCSEVSMEAASTKYLCIVGIERGSNCPCNRDAQEGHHKFDLQGCNFLRASCVRVGAHRDFLIFKDLGRQDTL